MQILRFWHYRIGVLEIRLVVQATNAESGTALAPTHDIAGRWPATSWVHCITSCNTQSSVPEDGQNNCPKHVEVTGIINKPLLLHLVGCLYYLYFIIFF